MEDYVVHCAVIDYFQGAAILEGVVNRRLQLDGFDFEELDTIGDLPAVEPFMDRVELWVLILKLDIKLLLANVLKNDMAECLAHVCAGDRALGFEDGTHGDLLKSPSEYLKDSEVGIGGGRS